MNAELIILGTGNAQATKCYNTCFIIKQDEDLFLVDAGGGNQILDKLTGDIDLKKIHHMFLTHAHTDHILGTVWVVRMIATAMNNGSYEGEFHIYTQDYAAKTLRSICEQTLVKKMTDRIDERIVIHELSDGEGFQACGMRFTAYDIGSTKMKQYGFLCELKDGRKISCCGDEPYNEKNRKYTEGVDWMMCEAFCLYEDRDRFKPYEKHHSTAADAGKLAEELKVKNLLLYHTEDKTLSSRKQKYTQEAASQYSGAVYVPDDMDRIVL